jgi:hypothetical protein
LRFTPDEAAVFLRETMNLPLTAAEERVRDFSNPVFMDMISAYQASIWRAQGDQAATTWLHDHCASLEQPLLLPLEKEYVTLVRLMIDAQQYDQALISIERLVAFVHTRDKYLELIRAVTNQPK